MGNLDGGEDFVKGKFIDAVFVPYGIRLFLFVCVGIMVACESHYSPKPRGFYRLEFPDHTYQSYESGCPFSFDFPTYALIEDDRSTDAKTCWMDVVYPAFNARLHLSYFPFANAQEFSTLVEDAHKFAFSHVAQASSIEQTRIQYSDQVVYGVWYDIGGNVASNVQFFLTDSSRHYLRGALYFNEVPRIDSIQPALDFLRVDVERMVKTWRWK